jgi:acyl-CoA-binding protein
MNVAIMQPNMKKIWVIYKQVQTLGVKKKQPGHTKITDTYKTCDKLKATKQKIKLHKNWDNG